MSVGEGKLKKVLITIAKQLGRYHFPENVVSEQINIAKKLFAENPMPPCIYLRIPDVWEDGTIRSNYMLDFVVYRDPVTNAYDVIYTG